MSENPTKQVPPYGLRMAPELKDRVAQSAERNSRSMNIEINHALELYLDQEAKRADGWAWVPPSLQVPQELVPRLEEAAQRRRSTVQRELFEAIVSHFNRVESDDDERRLELERLVGEIVDLVRYDLEAKARDGG